MPPPPTRTVPHRNEGGPIPDRQVRIAALADLHAGKGPHGQLVDVFSHVAREADVLALCGDLTDRGQPEEIQALVEQMAGVEIPIVAVFGNHDYESGQIDELGAILRDRGVHLLDGESLVIEGIGFAGVKGFGGGFGRYTIGGFGEPRLKEFIQEALDEALRLESALRTLNTDTRVVLMHFAPIVDTLAGEPEQLYPFLGSSRFIQPIETYGASVVFHGHAHYGTPEGRTPAGVEVYNVARHVLGRSGQKYRIWTGTAPDRRGTPELND